jgi:tRNA U34 2-thiouridine synthase MnmA/TrmU
MKEIKLQLTDRQYGKLIGASAALNQTIKRTASEFLEESADIVLTGNYVEIENEEKFERLRAELETK